MTRYNPDGVPADKVVHIDTIANKSLTYGGLREQAGRCAWGLKNRMGMREEDRLLVMVPNSVRLSPRHVPNKGIDVDGGRLTLSSSAMQPCGWEEYFR